MKRFKCFPFRSDAVADVTMWEGANLASLNPPPGTVHPHTPNPKPEPYTWHGGEREFCIDNLLVRIHYIIEMIWWTGLAPWEFVFPFPGSLRAIKREKRDL